MARAEVDFYDGPHSHTEGQRQIKVTLSRRNLLALLHKLDMEGSARRIENDVVYVHGRDMIGKVRLVLCAEDDAEHYADERRKEAKGVAGTMHPDTEAFITGSTG